MRKDVRLGFAVGGVLLAVIIVAVLVFHRNHGKQVVFDAGKAQASGGSTDQGPLDVGTPPADSPAKSAEPTTQTPSASPNTEQPAPPKHEEAPAAQPPVIASRTSDRWDALFATTGDPVTAQLTSQPEKPKRHRSGPMPQPELSTPSTGAEQAPNTPADFGGGNAAPAPAPEPSAPARSNPEPTTLVNDMSANHGRVHRVEAGETMVSIARAAYGDGRYYLAVQNANPSVNPNRLKPGTVLHLPPASEVKQSSRKRSSGESTESRATSGRDPNTYVVKKGDNLYVIAHRLGKSQDDLYTLNRETIGPDSTKLKIGMVLKVPSSSASASNQ